MAAFTASVTGNWNNAATWGGAGIPGSGDTATINGGITVTVPVGYTAVIGTSPTDDSGAVGLTINGTLNVLGTLKWQAPVRQGNATVTFSGGSVLTYDASGAATPASALYTWQIAQANAQANAKLVFNGTTGSRCTVNSQGGYQSGGFGNKTTAYNDGGRMEATKTDFSNQGAATTSGYLLQCSLQTAVSVFFDDCTMDQCGMILATGPYRATKYFGIDATATFRLSGVDYKRGVNNSYSLQVICGGNTLTTGQRLIENCVLRGRCDFTSQNEAGAQTDNGFTFRDFWVESQDIAGQKITTNLFGIALGGMTLFKDGFLNHTSPQSVSGAPVVGLGAPDVTATFGFGTINGLYSYVQASPVAFGANRHPVNVIYRYGNLSVQRMFADLTLDDVGSDFLNWTASSDATAVYTGSVTFSVFAHGAGGKAPGSLFNRQGGGNWSNQRLVWDNNTCAVGLSNGTQAAAGDAVYGLGLETTGRMFPGAIQSGNNNILYRLSSGPGVFFHPYQSTTTIDAGAVVEMNWNWVWNLTTTLYPYASTTYASTPGTNDQTGNPQFLDYTRRVLNFYTKYLGNSQGAAWSGSSVSYAAGDLRSTSDASFFFGETFTWRCIAAHTSGSTNQPGAGADYGWYWEPASFKPIRDSILAKETFGGKSMVGVLIDWAIAGFSPQNTATATASKTGGQVGAATLYVAASKYVSEILGTHPFSPFTLSGL